MHLRFLSLIAATAAGLVLVGIGGAHPNDLCTTSCITEYSLQSTGGGPFGVVAGRGGSVWYGHASTVGRIAADGTETEFAVPTGNANVGVVARGDGDTVWFAERLGNKIGHIDAEGNVVEYPIPSAPPCGNAGGAHTSLPQGIALARDQAIWFTEECANNIGRLDPWDGSVTEFTLPIPNSHPLGLVAGPDGALWFTQRFSAVGRITTDGELTEYPLASAAFPQRITVGHDRALWFTELGTSAIGRITVDGELSEFPVAGGAGPGIATGPDNAIWFTQFAANTISRMDLRGIVTNTYAVPTPASSSLLIAPGPQRTLWFGEVAANKLGRLQPFLADDPTDG